MKKAEKQADKKAARHLKKFGRHIKDHFIPHERNNHHPHVLSHRALVGYSVLLILVKVFAIFSSVALPSASVYSSSITPSNIVELTNLTRKNLGLDTLKVSDKLGQAAQAKADDMIINQYFAHQSPSGLTPWDWFKKVGYQYLYAGENLAVHYTASEDVQQGWMASPSHRANIVNPNYTEIGIGVQSGQFEGAPSIVVVQMFGKPVPNEIIQPSKQAPTSITIKSPEPAPQQLPSEPKVAAAESNAVKQLSNLPAAKQPTAAKPAALPEIAKAAPAAEQPSPIVPQAPLETANLASAAPVIFDDSLELQQQGNSYQIKITISNATKASAQLDSRSIDLVQGDTSDVWQGVISYDPATISQTGEQLAITAWGKDDTKVDQTVALVAPKTLTQQLYNFNDPNNREVSLFGFIKLTNLQDSVHRFYIYFMVFLGAALLINVFVKIRIQHPTVIGHAASVMALSLLLLLI